MCAKVFTFSTSKGRCPESAAAANAFKMNRLGMKSCSYGGQSRAIRAVCGWMGKFPQGETHKWSV